MTKETILIVDDNATNLDVLFHHLDGAGLEILVAEDGLEAVERAKRTQPDLILLDVMMPGLDGFETCRQLKNDPKTQHIPVIFMTAIANIESKVMGFAVGGVDYITKPFQLEEVLARVNSHLTILKLQRDLQAQARELQARNEELDAYARTVAHDLAGPAGRIMGFAELLAQEAGVMPAEELQEYAGIISRSARKMNEIIIALLLLARVRHQEVARRPVDMALILPDVLARLAERLNEYQPELIIAADWPIALGYAPWIEEVWVNYLSNALKYGGRPPRVELGATIEANHMARFWIRDNGPGLSPSEQTRLFTPFTRLHSGRIEGHGLGLSIVRRIIEKLGGQVGVESDGIPGRGSCFSFTLPLAPDN